MEKNKILAKLANVYTGVGFFLVTLSLILFFVPFAPYVIYSLKPNETQNEIEKITKDVSEVEYTTKDSSNSLPPQDSSLSKDPYIIIEKINVESPISSSSNYIDDLKKGSWLVPEYGTPMNGKKPIIIAAHRFGYSYWSREMREAISFYNLPKTHNQDTVKVIWDQRVFEYQIYKEEESTYISDYNADLILYTCKYFNSPIRIFRYASLITN